jgi:hypothetical protein
MDHFAQVLKHNMDHFAQVHKYNSAGSTICGCVGNTVW